MTEAKINPLYQIKAVGAAPPDYPAEPHPDTFYAGPVISSAEERRAAFIRHVLDNPSPQHTKSLWYELVRIAGGGQPHEGHIFNALKFVNDRSDCADFVVHSVLRLLIQFDPNRMDTTPNGRTFELAHPPSDELLAAAQETVLNFKYWPDEPGVDSMCYWTENHYILFSSAGYLAGQLYPDSTFRNSGETGREKMERNRPRILRWLEMRFKTGFTEWLSHVYYEEDLGALLSLYDFCEDQEIRRKAGQVIDLILLDMVLNQYRGVFGATHGRSYEIHKKHAGMEGTTDTMKLLFGRGRFSQYDNMAASAFVLSAYLVPAVLHEIFQDDTAIYINRQKAGFDVADQARWGWDYDSVEDGMIFYTNEAYLHPSTAATTLKMFDAFRWWENDFFAPFQDFRWLLRLLRTTKLLKPFAKFLEKDISRNMRGEPDIYTYKTPDYMLSTAQDHRKGFGGDQHHIWQATLAPEAVCFTTHPGRLEGDTPGYWEGSGVLPRSVQIKNLNITIYKIQKMFPGIYVPIRHFYTHAWLPKDRFDEVLEKEGWMFARKDEGYLALYSQHPYLWNQPDLNIEGCTIRKYEEDFHREMIVPGSQNIWLCQLGRQAEDGSFEEFVETMLASKLETNGLEIEFDSPGNGMVKVGWDGPLTLNGEQVALEHYPRYDNPYVQAAFNPSEIVVQANGEELWLDWA